jgi:uncharacterized delta-60 repeat protein
VQVDGDDKIILSGRATSQFLIVRYNADGSLDTNTDADPLTHLDFDGIVMTDVPGPPGGTGPNDLAYSVIAQSDGKLVAAGFARTSGTSFLAIARYNNDGSLDSTFNALGALPGTQSINVPLFTGLSNTSETGFGVAQQPDGAYVLAGFVAGPVTGIPSISNNMLVVSRVLDNGTLDTSFGTTGAGFTATDVSGPDTRIERLLEVAIQPDGKIIAGGNFNNQDFLLARYESGLVVASIDGAADVDEGAEYTLNLAASDPTITQWEIDWGDEVEIFAGNPTSVTHTYADGDANYVISASFTNGLGTTPVGNTVAVAVHNVAPALTISGAADVDEAALYTLTLSSDDPGDDTITQWTIDWGDEIEMISGNPASVTHTYEDGDANYVISATATDEDGAFAAGNTVAVMVHNVDPTAEAGGPYTSIGGLAITLNGSGNDVAGAADPLTFEWDFDGNLTTIEAFGATPTFDPVALGIVSTTVVTVTLRVTDGDGGEAFDTAEVTVLAEGATLIDGVLNVIGNSTTNDSVIITQSGGNISVNATFNSGDPDVFDGDDVEEIVIVMGSGNNIVVVSGVVTQPLTIDGGAGNDLISGGGGDDTLIGGEGNDILHGNGGDDMLLGGNGNDDLLGGAGNDSLVGGEGVDIVSGGAGNDLMIGSQDSDLLIGGNGEDILIGGWTIHDNDTAALDEVMAIWTSADSFNSRVAALTGAGGLLEAGETVFDDDSQDILVGGAGRDLVFGDNNPTDGVTDLLALQPILDVLVAVT